MKLGIKWFMWFSGIGIYIMILGGIFYHNLFRWTFDEKLKSEILEMVTLKSADLMDGLLESAGSITMRKEYPVIEFLQNDKRIADILYLDGAGRIRWFKHGEYLGKDFESFAQETGYNAASIYQAYQSGASSIISSKSGPFYDMAIPFKERGEEIIGILNLKVSREGANTIIRSAMRKYIIGALGVLFFWGFPLFLFIRFSIINPIVGLTDSIEGISAKNLEIKFSARNDEIGMLAQSVAGFLGKINQEMDTMSEKDEQRKSYENAWWKTILNNVVSKGNKALVIDEDNNVLFANFPLNRLDPEQKIHLLDVIDSDRQDILKMVGMALEKPESIIEADTVFKSESVHAKVVQMQSEGNFKRTLILFEKRQG
jgi:HAMP domain-containing protein